MKSTIKQALTCRSLQNYQVNTELNELYIPRMGDVALFRVVQPNGGYIMNTEKVSTEIFEGDTVMLAFGNRYATNQYEGYVPTTPVKQCHLLGRGGVAGTMVSKNATFKVSPAVLELIGYAVDEAGKVINTIQTEQLSHFNPFGIKAKVILSVGASMDSGKTTSAAWLCGGLHAAGKRVAFIKLTGTAFPKDAQLNFNRGADFAIDFSHFGFPSTFLLEKDTLLNLYQSLLEEVERASGAEYIVMEIADGILQRETAMLLNDSRFMSTIHATMFSAGDSLGVLSGVQVLQNMGIRPFAVTGLFTASELLIREVAHLISMPVLRLNDLLSAKATDLVLEETFIFEPMDMQRA
jgi:hypothetical protein